jgi:ADP-ribosylation factor GTPase-activating protein 1
MIVASGLKGSNRRLEDCTMAVDTRAEEFFQAQFEDFHNCLCCDSGRVQPFWASISYGIYISIEAAGVHRSLGVKRSRVQSITMDSWTPLHLTMMRMGGNRKFNDFLREHGIPEDLPIREKYNTRAAEWYRENLSALAQGLQALAPLQPGTGHLPIDSCPSPEEKKLDAVFKSITPCPDSMSAGGVHERYEECQQSYMKSVCHRLCRLCSCLTLRILETQIDESLEEKKMSDLDFADRLPTFLLTHYAKLNTIFEDVAYSD